MTRTAISGWSINAALLTTSTPKSPWFLCESKVRFDEYYVFLLVGFPRAIVTAEGSGFSNEKWYKYGNITLNFKDNNCWGKIGRETFDLGPKKVSESIELES